MPCELRGLDRIRRETGKRKPANESAREAEEKARRLTAEHARATAEAKVFSQQHSQSRAQAEAEAKARQQTMSDVEAQRLVLEHAQTRDRLAPPQNGQETIDLTADEPEIRPREEAPINSPWSESNLLMLNNRINLLTTKIFDSIFLRPRPPLVCDLYVFEHVYRQIRLQLFPRKNLTPRAESYINGRIEENVSEKFRHREEEIRAAEALTSLFR